MFTFILSGVIVLLLYVISTKVEKEFPVSVIIKLNTAFVVCTYFIYTVIVAGCYITWGMYSKQDAIVLSLFRVTIPVITEILLFTLVKKYFDKTYERQYVIVSLLFSAMQIPIGIAILGGYIKPFDSGYLSIVKTMESSISIRFMLLVTPMLLNKSKRNRVSTKRKRNKMKR